MKCGKIVRRVQKKRGGPTRVPAKAGLLSQDQKGQSYQGWWGTITSGRTAGTAVHPGTGPCGLVEEAEGRLSLYSTIGPSYGLKPMHPSDRKFAKVSAASGSLKKVSGGV
jgi:hypothetical protein